MLISEKQLKINFANRLNELRRASGMTQLELAERLNYSDKSISKWERADGIPDLYVVMQIADIFEVTPNDLVSDKPFKRAMISRNKLIITFLAMAAPWLLATIANWITGLILPEFPVWYYYIFAIPVTAIIAIVFTSIWWNRLWRFISVSALIWSIPTCVFSLFSTSNNAFIYIVAAVVQVMAILSFLIKKRPKYQKRNKEIKKDEA